MLTHERFKCPYEFDIALIEPVCYMMRRGIRVDVKKKKELSSSYKNQWIGLQMKLNAIAGHELNVNSPKQISNWLYREAGMPPRKVKHKLSTNEDTLRSLLSMCEHKMSTLKTEGAKMKWTRAYVGIWHILKIRGVRKKISSYLDITIDDDDRARTTLRIGGTETGRLSSSKTAWRTGLNLQTVPLDLRIMYIADEGKEMAEFDLNRGESWIYAHLSNEPTMMETLATGTDFHVVTACAISSAFGDRIRIENWEKFDEENSDKAYRLRFLGKKANHAFSYRMGAFRAAETVNQEADDTGITITVAQAKVMRQLWLSQYIGIPAWWASIERDLTNNERLITTPYGRQRTFYERWGDDLFKEATAYVPQSTSVDYLNLGMLDVFHDLVIPRRYGLELLHQNHDSILVQYDQGYRDKIFPEIIERCHRSVNINGHDIKIPIEGSYGQNWRELTEWKEAA